MSPILTLRLAGVALLLAATATPWLLPAVAPIGTDGPETFVRPDGVATTVPVVDHRPTMLWVNEADGGPPCQVTTPTGAPLRLTPVREGPRRDGGPIGDYVGTVTVRPDSSTIVVTCAESSGVHVTAVPYAVAGWRAILVVALVTLGLAVAGLWCLVAAGRRVSTPRTRSG